MLKVGFRKLQVGRLAVFLYGNFWCVVLVFAIVYFALVINGSVFFEFIGYFGKFCGKNANPFVGRKRIFAKVEQSHLKTFRGFSWFMF